MVKFHWLTGHVLVEFPMGQVPSLFQIKKRKDRGRFISNCFLKAFSPGCFSHDPFIELMRWIRHADGSG